MEHRDFHWLVGILEGEGTFLAGPPSRPATPVVRVVMTDRDVVERVGALFQRAVVRLRPRQAHYRTPYATAIRGSSAVALMNSVRFQLSDHRQRQIDVALASRSRGIRCSPIRPLAPAIDLASCRPQCESDWLAGLLEGEGTFSSTSTGKLSYPTLKVEMSDESVVTRAAAVFGANVWRVPAREALWQPTFATAITGHDAAEWMRTLHPLMGDRRRDAIERALLGYQPIRLVNPPSTCVVPGCDAPHRSRGLCHKHYMSWMRDRVKGREPRINGLR